MRPNGKGTEKLVVQKLREAYGLRIDIQRMADLSDTGQYQDVRPSDFIVILERKLAEAKNIPQTYYIEAKETAKKTKSINFNSVFRKGQIQAMKRSVALGIPYFIVFNFLDAVEDQLYLIPCTIITENLALGKKSISVDLIKQHPWKSGALYDY